MPKLSQLTFLLKQKREALLFVLFGLIIFIFHIWYIRDTNVLAIRNDEYGYWNHAALLSGHDWSEVFANHMNWYSYGYSLVLVPLFYLTSNLYAMYKTAIVLNGIFGILTYILCLLCAKRLFPRIKPWLRLCICFMVCMYSSYITQSQIAWSETFLYLFIWLLFYLFLRFEQNPSTGTALLLSTVTGYTYIIHNRTIGILAAYLLLVILLRLAGRISWKTCSAMLSPLLLILLVNTNIKTWLCMIEGFGLKAKNGLGGQKDHFLSLLTLTGWRNLLLSFSGQLWTLFTSSFGLVYWGLVRCLTSCYKSLRQNQWERHTSFYLFVLLASLATFSVSAISLIDPASITNLSHNTDLTYFIYTRYDECVIGILLLTGFMELTYRPKDSRFIQMAIIGSFLYTAFGILLHFNLQRIESSWHYRSFCAAGIGFYRLFSKEFSVLFCSLFASAIAAVVTLLVSIHKKGCRRLQISLACLLLTAVFIPTGLYSAKIGTILSQRGKISCGNLGLYQDLKKVVGTCPVYCTLDNTPNYRIAYEIQVNLINTRVFSVTTEEIPLAEDNYFVCCSNGDLHRWNTDDLYLLAQSKAYSVLVKGADLKNKIQPLAQSSLKNVNELTVEIE